MSTLIDFQNVSVSFDAAPILRGVSFSVAPGEVVGLVGESGSGKTTLLRAALGLLPPSAEVSGRILFEGRDLLSLGESELRHVRGAKIALVLQDSGSALCPVRKVGALVYEALAAHESVTREEARERALSLLSRLRFEDAARILDSCPFELSGGMSQRVGVALSLLLRPRLILADEPTSALDAAAARETLRLLMAAREEGAGLILVTHDLAAAQRAADRLVVIRKGRVEQDAAYAQGLLAAAPRLRRGV